jgi:hypothetical protein
MQEDFRQLQVVNKSLLLAALTDSALDPKAVSKSAGEINKRAERLHKNLWLRAREKTNGQLTTVNLTSPEQLKPSILRLGQLIFNFVDNPSFRAGSVVDAQQTSKAQRDLGEIIEVSRQIKKNSERLQKEH